MKSIACFTLLAALAVPAFAADEEELVPADNEVKAEVPREPAVWPAFFAFSEWPETPDLIGLRLTIPFSTKQECVTGIDLGFWGRSKDFEGLAVNILRNDVRDSFCGLQVGFYNSINRGDLGCIEVGLWNEAYSFRGFQIALVNVTGDGQGFQIGLINRAETLYGFQAGLINVIRSAEIPVLPVVNIGF